MLVMSHAETHRTSKVVILASKHKEAINGPTKASLLHKNCCLNLTRCATVDSR